MTHQNIPFKKILYATDLSDSAVHAYSYACSLADAYSADIIMLHVIAERIGEEFITSMISAKTLQEIRDRYYSEARKNLIGKKKERAMIKDVLQAFSDEAKVNQHPPNNQGNDEEILIEEGPPPETIVRIAKEEHCDLIVMGRHGQSGITEFITGSTTKKVIDQSTLPVLVVRLSDNQQDTRSS